MRLLALFLATTLLTAAEPAPAPLADVLRRAIDEQGVPAAEQVLAGLRSGKFAGVAVDEGKLNELGYHYLGAGRAAEALLVLQANAELHPNSANAADSLGEALVLNGDGAGAIASYAKSLELDPKNANALAMLSELKLLPDAVKFMQARLRFNAELNAAFEAQEKDVPIDLPGLRAKLHALLDANAADAAAGLVANYLYLSEAVDLAGAVEDWKYIARSPNAKIREMGERRAGLIAALPAPLELKFQALDGRPVDLAQLRGKVVLVDFWATWCGPCVAEIPNVVATYRKFHDRGFEIVGISFDQAPDAAKPHRRQKSAEQVAAFTRDHDMPWPQYYDGQYWNNAFGKQYGIHAIPAMFLLDRSGRIVSTNARGPKLTREVQRLLGP